ncbi:hypothetical protein [Acuticoccus sp. I52.16.1]|uniref:hypothetical protein n=1 Tax=Acuticoccus sp. I52.16.1 TaxID=2928472 RepID=UPI001FD4EF47|nr:hypothetical protein [Acuticoccus sp. I52.16.1]UOM35121.1 hypothetical protein MRB58_02595 [Acuticoccus sp. I52.16.1]
MGSNPIARSKQITPSKISRTTCGRSAFLAAAALSPRFHSDLAFDLTGFSLSASAGGVAMATASSRRAVGRAWFIAAAGLRGASAWAR